MDILEELELCLRFPEKMAIEFESLETECEKTIRKAIKEIKEIRQVILQNMTVDNIMDLKREYLKRAGKLPMTSESIHKVFGD